MACKIYQSRAGFCEGKSMTLQSFTSEAIAPEIPEINYPDSDGNPMSDNTEKLDSVYQRV